MRGKILHGIECKSKELIFDPVFNRAPGLFRRDSTVKTDFSSMQVGKKKGGE